MTPGANWQITSNRSTGIILKSGIIQSCYTTRNSNNNKNIITPSSSSSSSSLLSCLKVQNMSMREAKTIGYFTTRSRKVEEEKKNWNFQKKKKKQQQQKKTLKNRTQRWEKYFHWIGVGKQAAIFIHKQQQYVRKTKTNERKWKPSSNTQWKCKPRIGFFFSCFLPS